MEELIIRGDLGGAGAKRGRGGDDDDPRRNDRRARLDEEATKLRKDRKAKIAQVRKRYGELILAVGSHDLAMNLLAFEFTRKEIEDANLRARD